MSRHFKELFSRRVSERDVARLLSLIAEEPDRREAPQEGAVQGDFDHWFDGGACRVLTGWLEYEFEHGTTAEVAAPVPNLSVGLRLPDGRRVQIQQIDEIGDES